MPLRGGDGAATPPQGASACGRRPVCCALRGGKPPVRVMRSPPFWAIATSVELVLGENASIAERSRPAALRGLFPPRTAPVILPVCVAAAAVVGLALAQGGASQPGRPGGGAASGRNAGGGVPGPDRARRGRRDFVRERLHRRHGGRLRLADGSARRGELDAGRGALPADAGRSHRLQQRAVRARRSGRGARGRPPPRSLQDRAARIALFLRRRRDPAGCGARSNP